MLSRQMHLELKVSSKSGDEQEVLNLLNYWQTGHIGIKMGNSPSQSGFHPPPPPPPLPTTTPTPTPSSSASNNGSNGEVIKNLNPLLNTETTVNFDLSKKNNTDKSNTDAVQPSKPKYSWNVPATSQEQQQQQFHSIDSLLLDTLPHNDMDPSSISPGGGGGHGGGGIMVQSGYEVRDDADVLSHYYDDDSLEIGGRSSADDVDADSIVSCIPNDKFVEKDKEDDKEEVEEDEGVKCPESLKEQEVPPPPPENKDNIRESPSSSGFLSDLDPASFITTTTTISPILNKINNHADNLIDNNNSSGDGKIRLENELNSRLSSPDSNSNRAHENDDDHVGSAPIIIKPPSPQPPPPINDELLHVIETEDKQTNASQVQKPAEMQPAEMQPAEIVQSRESNNNEARYVSVVQIVNDDALPSPPSPSNCDPSPPPILEIGPTEEKFCQKISEDKGNDKFLKDNQLPDEDVDANKEDCHKKIRKVTSRLIKTNNNNNNDSNNDEMYSFYTQICLEEDSHEQEDEEKVEDEKNGMAITVKDAKNPKAFFQSQSLCEFEALEKQQAEAEAEHEMNKTNNNNNENVNVTVIPVNLAKIGKKKNKNEFANSQIIQMRPEQQQDDDIICNFGGGDTQKLDKISEAKAKPEDDTSVPIAQQSHTDRPEMPATSSNSENPPPFFSTPLDKGVINNSGDNSSNMNLFGWLSLSTNVVHSKNINNNINRTRKSGSPPITNCRLSNTLNRTGDDGGGGLSFSSTYPEYGSASSGMDNMDNTTMLLSLPSSSPSSSSSLENTSLSPILKSPPVVNLNCSNNNLSKKDYDYVIGIMEQTKGSLILPNIDVTMEATSPSDYVNEMYYGDRRTVPKEEQDTILITPTPNSPSFPAPQRLLLTSCNSNTNSSTFNGNPANLLSPKVEDMKHKLEEANADQCVLIQERDQALEDLCNVESAFSDVHRKYERSKGILQNLKDNENMLLQREQELVQKIENRDKKLAMYKEKAQEKLEQMYQDYESKMKELEVENTRLRAQCRLLDMKLATLEHDVEQKAKENSQLNALCNELISGQGGNSGSQHSSERGED